MVMCGCCRTPAVKDDTQTAYASDWRELPEVQQYDIGNCVGTGAFAEVYLAKEMGTGHSVALKIVDLRRKGMSKGQASVLGKEALWLQQLRHPGIVTCHRVLEGGRHQVLVLEYLSGGEMLDHLHLIDHYSEALAAQLMCQVVGAVAHMHAAGILHRDIKPENIMFVDSVQVCQEEKKQMQVKLIDLGMAAKYDPQHLLRGFLGSPGFAAPEIASGGKHTPAMDVYSLGVLLFIMLCGRQPFDIVDVVSRRYADKRIASAPGVADPRFCNCSKEARRLMLRMLSENPLQRPSAAEVLQDPWVLAQTSEEQLNRKLDVHAQKRLAYLGNLRSFTGVVNGLQKP